MDIFDKSKRSQLMAKVKQKNTAPEIIVRKFLFSKGFRYRINVKSLSGTPDIVLSKYKTVIFVHGCFWHGHTCRAGHLPSSNLDYWVTKIEKNIERDNRKINELEKLGWNVVVIWQCEIKALKNREIRFSKLISEIERK
ncbi:MULTISPECIES: very short patch repair endonuclease [Bacteroidales]|jgi:DNA mismatch endonuclease (patch repair protein)|nr:DNA mismatch endonuclease Vsr [Parabacteroides distasonis]MCS2559729.1 DNA mismatch endonuclease Vsr [Parabacteroides distasonis]RGT97451.1 DNA mismatch endonuclease Vsr [Parabacteroides distasonis]